MHPLGHDYPAARHHARIDPEGRYAIDALEPGVHEFWAEPLALAAPLRIEIFADDVTRSFDVVLRDP